MARPKTEASKCPCCGCQTRRVHSHYMRRLADLPWQGRVVEIRLHARRFRCADRQCRQRIFAERLPETVRPKARRTSRLGESQLAIGFAVGGKPGSRLSHKLAMPVSGDTLLRMIRAAGFEPEAPRVVGIDDWAWRKGQRYGTIVCDLERNRVLDLLPDRNADTVASWLRRYPGIEVVARDRAGLYAEGARRGAPDATQVADRWHLLQNLGDALRLAIGRHRKAVTAAGKAMIAEIAENDDDAGLEPSVETSTKLDGLRRSRRNQRRERYAEILQLRTSGMWPRQIAPRIGVSVRTVERWLAAGGEPEHRRRTVRSVLMDPFQEYLETRWQEGQHNGLQLWTEIKRLGFAGSHKTVYRWTAARKERPPSSPPEARWPPPSRRKCAWLLSENPASLDEPAGRFLHHLYETAPELSIAGDLARRFALIRGDDDAGLDQGSRMPRTATWLRLPPASAVTSRLSGRR
ncbi:ISL3 family transposase [Mesorhizobium dulcispinae]|uniref:ISL3 family transposase n=1 Tax=Mesorhizobium dulcispinae TaxID=3072316 RepID=UPI003D3146F8